MTTEQAKTIDKSQWGDGPWMNEPDRLEFEAHGFPCLIRRTPTGILCGYVAMPPGHPWHGKCYDDVPADVHGGLTYADACAGDICHVPKPGAARCVCEVINGSNGSRVHGGNPRWRGLDQPDVQHDSQNKNRPPGDIAEIGGSGNEHQRVADHVADGIMGARGYDNHSTPEATAAQAGMDVADAGRGSGAIADQRLAVPGYQGAAGSLGVARTGDGGTAGAETGRRPDGGTGGAATGNDDPKQEGTGEVCAGCGAVKDASNVFWLGFDHGHFDDVIPCMVKRMPDPGFPATYKDIAYARAGCESLAYQAMVAARG